MTKATDILAVTMPVITVTGNCTPLRKSMAPRLTGTMNRAIERGQLARVIAAGGWSKA